MSTEEIETDERPFNSITRVSVVGVGGAGNNLLSHAIGGGVSPSRCVAVNTDRGQLSRSLARNKVFLEQIIKPASESLLAKSEDQKTLQSAAHRVTTLTDGSDFTIVVTGLGGSTGTESAPIIAQRSRTAVRPVVAVVAIPFVHERERRFIALRGLKRMVDACDCTVVIDNAVDRDYLSPITRSTDETASLAVRSLTELMSGAEDIEARDILKVLSSGDLATVSHFSLRTGDTLQSAVIQALKTPSANLPLEKAKGAIMLYRGPATLSTAQFAHAYDALVSLVGGDVSFIHGSIYTASEPSVSLFLTGYSYGSALSCFTEFVELYDVEYGEEESEGLTTLSVPLYQMEQVERSQVKGAILPTRFV